MATGTNLFTSHEARILAHTPNNTSTFLRGDNTWTNTLEGNFIINNTSGGDCYIEIRRQDNADWRILGSGGNLYFQSDWTTEKGAYFNVLQLDFNTGHAYVKGNITASNGYLKSTLNSNTVTIGSQNAGFCHIYNSANIPFIFNNTIECAGALNDTTASLGTTAYPFHHLVLGGTTDATMTAASTNPRITFQEGTGTQPVHLVYTDYDSYRNPAGLKVVGGTDATPAWFEVEGDIYCCHGIGTSTASSWIDGQRYNNGGWNLTNANNTGSYWPWMRQTNTASAKWFSFGILGNSFYWIGSSTSRTANSYDKGMYFDVSNGYLQGAARVYSAVWNDFAEMREADCEEPGRVIARSHSHEHMIKTWERLQPAARIISDTYGQVVGQSDNAKTPIGVAGRVLVYPYQNKNNYRIGDVVCAAPNGTADIMTREEIINYPDRIIGIVDEIPDYEIWTQTFTHEGGGGNTVSSVKVNGRIWIYVR